MGLRKNTKKFIKKIFFEINFFLNKRKSNIEPDNYADMIISLPEKDREIDIPKKIWIFWDNQRPPLVEYCIQRLEKFNKNYEINILNTENLHTYCDIDFSKYNNLTPQLKSDLLRLYLLYNYGGIWLDASIITYSNLDWIIELCKENKTSTFGFYRKQNTTIIKYPVLESWLIATEKNNIFFQLWFKELEYAIQITPKEYINHLKRSYENHHEYFQNIGLLEYLVIYVACQKIMRTQSLSITCINCDKNAFLYHGFNNNFDPVFFIESLVLSKRPKNMPYLIKLIGSDRNLLSPYLQKNKFKKDSLLDI